MVTPSFRRTSTGCPSPVSLAHHNALFTLRGVSPRRAIERLPVPKPDIEALATGPGVIFWSISKQHQNRTTWMRLAAAPVYKQVTVRNHRTVFRLRELLEEL